jgi:hypothetical protein
VIHSSPVCNLLLRQCMVFLRVIALHLVTCAFSSQPSQASLLQKPAVIVEVAKVSNKNSKGTLTQKKNTEAVGSKQPTAAEESFYTGRGVQPRKTIDGLPVFSLAEMV